MKKVKKKKEEREKKRKCSAPLSPHWPPPDCLSRSADGHVPLPLGWPPVCPQWASLGSARIFLLYQRAPTGWAFPACRDPCAAAQQRWHAPAGVGELQTQGTFQSSWASARRAWGHLCVCCKSCPSKSGASQTLDYTVQVPLVKQKQNWSLRTQEVIPHSTLICQTLIIIHSQTQIYIYLF